MRLNGIAKRPAKSFVGLIIFLVASAGYSQQQAKSESTSHTRSGPRIFATNCSGCHGLDGTGSQRAPNIVNNSQVEKLSRDELFRIVSHGVPGTGMPAFQQLGNPAITSLVSYVRSLQGKSRTGALPGDPKRGEEVFFGTGQCSTCHMVAGKGGFIGPDLTSYAQTHTAEKIKQAIIDPAQRDSSRKVVTAVTNDGEYRGIVLNEDNFSLQLQTLDGKFHFFSKPDVKAINREQNSIMPSDYASKLSGAQLDDVINYLVSVGKSSVPEKSDSEEGD